MALVATSVGIDDPLFISTYKHVLKGRTYINGRVVRGEVDENDGIWLLLSDAEVGVVSCIDGGLRIVSLDGPAA
jgi:hypothetical protein